MNAAETFPLADKLAWMLPSPRALRHFGWKAEYCLDRGLAETIAWMKGVLAGC